MEKHFPTNLQAFRAKLFSSLAVFMLLCDHILIAVYSREPFFSVRPFDFHTVFTQDVVIWLITIHCVCFMCFCVLHTEKTDFIKNHHCRCSRALICVNIYLSVSCFYLLYNACCVLLLWNLTLTFLFGVFLVNLLCFCLQDLCTFITLLKEVKLCLSLHI